MSDRPAAALALLGVVALAAGVAALVTRRSGGPALSRAAARARGPELLPVEAAVRDRHREFHRALRPWTYTSLVVGLVVPLLYGLTPLGAALVDRLTTGPVPVRAALGGLVLAALAEALGLPFALRREVVLRRYGLSVRTWRAWLGDAAKSAAIGGLLSGAALAVLYGLLGAAPRWWWAWAAPGAAAVVVVLAFVFPVLVEPLFLRFAPMEPSPLRDRLLALADRGGVPVRDVLVADASRRTTALNAYVSGFGATRRIVVFDTLVSGAPAEEVEVVVAHELGHAARRDVLGGTALAALGAAALCCLLHLALTSSPVLRAAGASGPADPRSVGVLFAVLAVAGLLLGPAQNLLSRRIEARADTFALDLSRRPGVFAAMQRRLALTNLADLDPGPVPYLLFASHPTTVQRIAAAYAFARAADLPLDHPDAPGRTPEAPA